MDELELNKKLFEAVEANDVKRVDLLLKQGAWVLAENNFNERRYWNERKLQKWQKH